MLRTSKRLDLLVVALTSRCWVEEARTILRQLRGDGGCSCHVDVKPVLKDETVANDWRDKAGHKESKVVELLIFCEFSVKVVISLRHENYNTTLAVAATPHLI